MLAERLFADAEIGTTHLLQFFDRDLLVQQVCLEVRSRRRVSGVEGREHAHTLLDLSDEDCVLHDLSRHPVHIGSHEPTPKRVEHLGHHLSGNQFDRDDSEPREGVACICLVRPAVVLDVWMLNLLQCNPFDDAAYVTRCCVNEVGSARLPLSGIPFEQLPEEVVSLHESGVVEQDLDVQEGTSCSVWCV